jgi:hypothetical protein
MDIKRCGTQPSQKAPAEHFTDEQYDARASVQETR